MPLLYLLLVYVLLVWVGLRFVVPHLGFRKAALPLNIPGELEAHIRRLTRESGDNAELLSKAYSFVTQRYTGGRIKTVTNFWKAFQDPLTIPPGFMPCNSQNYLLRLILIKSGRFTEQDIQVRIAPLNLFIHQYLRVRVNDSWVDVDPWAVFAGIPLGTKLTFLEHL